MQDSATNLLVVTTRHDTHAALIRSAISKGKAVFVENRYASTEKDLEGIINAYQHAEAPFVMVGFNRRFAPLVASLKSLLMAKSQPKSFIYTINAGHIPGDHWTQDLEIGGGRLLGEGCHFVDLLRYLAAASITQAYVTYSDPPGPNMMDTFTIQLDFADGSIGSIHYFANGSKSFPKERLEVFCGGSVIQLDNFRKLEGYGWKGFHARNLAPKTKVMRMKSRPWSTPLSKANLHLSHLKKSLR